jgi:multidrug resistance protein
VNPSDARRAKQAYPSISSQLPKGFGTLWVAVAVDLMGFGIIIPLLPLYADSFGASPATIGLLFSSYALAQFALSPWWGKLSDRIGRKPVLMVTIAGSAVGSIVLALAGSIWMLFLGRIIDGMSGASVAVARAAVADFSTPKDRVRLMGLLSAAFGFGFIIGPGIGALAALGGLSLPYYVAAVIALINLATVSLRVRETRPAVQSESRVLPGPANRPKPIMRLVVLTFLGITAFSGFEATFALLGQARLDMTAPIIAAVIAAVGVVLTVIQAVVVGPLARRIGETNLIRLGLSINVAGFLITSIASTWPILALGLLGLAVGQGLTVPAVSSAIAGLSPRGGAGQMLGFQQSASGLARVVGPALGGVLFGAGIPLPYILGAVLTVAALPLVPAPRMQSAPAQA